MTLIMGFIGFGKSANRYHLPYLSLRDQIRVKTIYRRTEKPELEATYREKGVLFTSELSELLDDPAIQLVTICTPAHTHYELAKQVIEAGKHVIVEKPFCSTMEEAKELLALGKEKGLMVMPYQNRRFDGDFLALKQVLTQGYVGEPLEIESHFDYYRPHSNPHPGPNVEGSFYGLGIHTIDQIVSLLGRPKKVVYDIRSVRHEESTDDYFEVDLHYSRTLKAKVKTSHLVAKAYPKFILHGTKGSFIKYGIDQQENDLKVGMMPGTPGFGQDSPSHYGVVTYVNANGDWIEKQIPTPIGDYGRVYDAAYDTIIHGAPKMVSDFEILTDMEILQSGFNQPSPSVYTLEEIK